MGNIDRKKLNNDETNIEEPHRTQQLFLRLSGAVRYCVGNGMVHGGIPRMGPPKLRIAKIWPSVKLFVHASSAPLRKLEMTGNGRG